MKILIPISCVLIALSLAYYLVVRPIQKDSALKDCVRKAEITKNNMEKLGANPLESFQIYSEAKDNCHKIF
ncbi:MAG: hypothetical protein WCV79_02310 [Candidatus Paceibacterota bacterium]|jgi:hypothetical protein